MLVLLDNGIPRGLRRFLPGHTVVEARDRNWDIVSNGTLIAAAQRDGFQVLITNDKNIRYQQNLQGRTLALIVLEHSQWPMVKKVVAEIAEAVDSAVPGSYLEIAVPFKD